MKITHIGHDSQFLKFAAELFEAVVPGANYQIAVRAPSNTGIRFPANHGRTVAISRNWRDIVRIPLGVRDSDVVIAHAMTPYAAVAFLCTPRPVIRIWCGWGADYYYDKYGSVDRSLLGPLTEKVLDSLECDRRSENVSALGRLRDFASHFLAKAAASRASAFSAPVPADYEVFRQRFPNFSGSYVQLDYASVEATFRVGGDEVTGRDILVGNSATLSNNHLEVFASLAALDLSGRRVIVPLSYGEQGYRDRIMCEGRDLLGENFVPVTEYMKLEEYSALIGQCEVVIMNHMRQQALGNIGTALYRGARLYMHRESPVLKFLRSYGAVVSTVDELRMGDPLPHRLDAGQVETNRNVLSAIWGEQVVRNHVQAAVNLVPR